ncbi:MAG: rhomboid family intramembrane serine protease [Chloroflexota bacterium]
MFPLRDINPTRRFPIFTYTLIAANVLVFLWQLTMSQQELFAMWQSLTVVPRNISAAPLALESILDTFRSMFFHGGWAHLGGNMLYLFLFGDNVEDYLGKVMFLVVYFASGVAAVAAQVITDPNSTIPLVGASGAIAGVLGSYLVLYPNVRVQGIIFLGGFGIIRELPAWLVLGFWFVIQLFNGIAGLGVQTGGGVAFFAHVGGFVLGAALTYVLMMFIPHPDAPERVEMVYRKRGY